MKLIDVNNIDYVSLEDSLHKIEHKKGDEVDCVIAAEIVQAIPLDRIKKAREEIEYEAFVAYGEYDNPQSYYEVVEVEDVLKILDKMIAESEE